MGSDRQRRREAGRLDAEQVDEPIDAVDGAVLDDEILGWRAGRYDLWPNAGVAGMQPALIQVRPVAPDSLGETPQPARIDGVVDGVDPFHVRPEPGLTG